MEVLPWVVHLVCEVEEGVGFLVEEEAVVVEVSVEGVGEAEVVEDGEEGETLAVVEGGGEDPAALGKCL